MPRERVSRGSVAPTNAAGRDQNAIRPENDIYQRTQPTDEERAIAEKTLKHTVTAAGAIFGGAAGGVAGGISTATGVVGGISTAAQEGFLLSGGDIAIGAAIGALVVGAVISGGAYFTAQALIDRQDRDNPVSRHISQQINNSALSLAQRRRGRIQLNQDNDAVRGNHAAVLEAERNMLEQQDNAFGMGV